MKSDLTAIHRHNPVEGRLGYILRRASVVMMTDLAAALAPLDLRPVEATILVVIGANPNCTQSEIGRMLGIARANMAPLIASLAVKGLIEKIPVDGRSHALSLSDVGTLRRDEAEAVTAAHEASFEAKLPDDEVAMLRAALGRLLQAGSPSEQNGG